MKQFVTVASLAMMLACSTAVAQGDQEPKDAERARLNEKRIIEMIRRARAAAARRRGGPIRIEGIGGKGSDIAFVRLRVFPAVRKDVRRAVDQVKPQKQLGKVKMAFYHFGYLKRGAKRDEVLKKLGGFKELQIHKAHLDYLDKLARTGRLVLCGRFLDRAGKDPTHRLVLFPSKARTEKQAYLERPEIQKLMATDPWVSRGVLRLELNLWMGPAGITYPGQEQFLKPDKPAQRKKEK